MNRFTGEQLKCIQEVLQCTVKTDQASTLNNRPWKTIPVPHNSDGKWMTLMVTK